MVRTPGSRVATPCRRRRRASGRRTGWWWKRRRREPQQRRWQRTRRREVGQGRGQVMMMVMVMVMVMMMMMRVGQPQQKSSGATCARRCPPYAAKSPLLPLLAQLRNLRLRAVVATAAAAAAAVPHPWTRTDFDCGCGCACAEWVGVGRPVSPWGWCREALETVPPTPPETWLSTAHPGPTPNRPMMVHHYHPACAQTTAPPRHQSEAASSPTCHVCTRRRRGTCKNETC